MFHQFTGFDRQGRFKTRLSLSSANVDEVIQSPPVIETDFGYADADPLEAGAAG
jgi:hypothetical protein